MAAAAAMDFLFLSLTSIAVTRHNINWTKVRTKVNHVAAAATLLLLLLLPLHCFVVFVVFFYGAALSILAPSSALSWLRSTAEDCKEGSSCLSNTAAGQKDSRRVTRQNQAEVPDHEVAESAEEHGCF